MIKLLQTGHALASHRRAEEARPAPRRLPGPRRRARRGAAPRRPREVRPPRARRHRRARRRRQAGRAELHARRHALARRAGRLEAAPGRRRAAVPGAAAGDRRRVRCAHRRHLRARQAGRRHARDLDDAAALRAARGHCRARRWSSSRAFAPASTSCACAARPARSIRSSRSWWEELCQAGDEERRDLLDSVRETRGPRRVKRETAARTGGWPRRCRAGLGRAKQGSASQRTTRPRRATSGEARRRGQRRARRRRAAQAPAPAPPPRRFRRQPS